jgi:hypothetical protein
VRGRRSLSISRCNNLHRPAAAESWVARNLDPEPDTANGYSLYVWRNSHHSDPDTHELNRGHQRPRQERSPEKVGSKSVRRWS